MRAITDLIENIVGSIRMIVMLIVGGIILTTMVISVGAYAVSDEAMDKLAEAAAEERRAAYEDYEYYNDGYGSERYSDGATYDENGEEYVGGWGD